MPTWSPPDVRYATTADGVRIAYTIEGSGPPLVYVRAFNSHAQDWWTTGWTAAYLRALAERFSVVVFDARGNGLSGVTATVDLEALVEDLRAVMDDASLDGVTLYGQGFGSPIAIAYAARHPERLARLVLYCAYSLGEEIFVSDTFIETMRTMPHAAAAFMGRETYPDDEELPSRLLSLESMKASPETAVAYFEFVRSVDVTEFVPRVVAPTLVMQPERNPQIRERLGRDVAEAIPGALYKQIPGGAYNPYASKSFEPTLAAIGEFVGVQLLGASRSVILLLTDMVSSTEMTQRVGESVSRELHTEHDKLVRSAADAHNGAVVQHTGDGMMLSFDTTSDGLACAVEIRTRCAERNADAPEPLDLRIGVVAGEAHAHNGQPFNAAAQLVTRVTATGGPGEVVAADPLPDLATGYRFDPPHTVALKGFPGSVRLYRLLAD